MDKTVRDMQGNQILKDTLLYIQPPFPILWKVAAVEEGGLMTPQGLTPAVVQLYTDVTFRQPPGQPFMFMIRIVQPSQDELLNRIAKHMGPKIVPG